MHSSCYQEVSDSFDCDARTKSTFTKIEIFLKILLPLADRNSIIEMTALVF